MGKARILVTMHYLELGGAEISLIGLLQALDPERVDVDLFLYDHRGELMEFIPRWVNVLPPVGAYTVLERPMAEALRRGHPGVVWGRLKARLRARHDEPVAARDDARIFQHIGECVTPHLPRINPGVEYDLAISFLTPHHIVRDRVRARRRVAWIHTDYSTVHIDRRMALAEWGAFDNIVSISPQVTRTFTALLPELADRVVEIENFLSPEFVSQRAREFNARAEMPGSPVLLSIGRYCEAKNYDNLPDIARRLSERIGRDFRWYIIGYGASDQYIREAIDRAAMHRNVILLGKRTNPYPYIAAADVYVQPSRYEGKSVTVREAQMLGRPVIVTDYPTARGQITDGVDGLIVPLDNAACADALADALQAPSRLAAVAAHNAAHDFGNLAAATAVYALLPPLAPRQS